MVEDIGDEIIKIGCIYIIRNKYNEKVYIGQTTQGAENRWKQHLKPSNKKWNNYALYRAMNKYGVENFYYEVLEDNIPYEELDGREIFYIEQYDSYKHGYNSTPGGDGKTLNKLEDLTDIVNRLKNGELATNIAKDYGVHPYTLRRNLQSIGVKTPKDIQGKVVRYDLRTLPREEIKELYLQGKTHGEIAGELNVNQRSVSRVIKEFGLNKKNMIDYSKLDLDAIIYDYDNHTMPVREIWKKYGINQHSIKVIRKMKQEELSKVI